ncbi:glycosyltransferase family 2 protein [Alphaproteobacteria bacterium]|nr:glycosyltransferase family 2 protein [Alphaproteobacteria bacterium]
MKQTSTSELLIICPCFNEANTIGELIDEIASLNENFDVIVIDDGSEDGTYQTALAKANTVRLPLNLGIGGAVQTGYRYAVRHGYEYAIQIDGDGQHDPAYIQVLLSELKKSSAHMAIGTRYKVKKGFQSSRTRRLGGRIIAELIGKLFSFRPTDPTSGMRLTNREATRVFSENYPIDFPEPLSLCSLMRKGFEIIEVPVVMRERVSGKSSISGIKPLLYMVTMILRIMSERLNWKGKR